MFLCWRLVSNSVSFRPFHPLDHDEVEARICFHHRSPIEKKCKFSKNFTCGAKAGGLCPLDPPRRLRRQFFFLFSVSVSSRGPLDPGICLIIEGPPRPRDLSLLSRVLIIEMTVLFALLL